MAPEIQDNVSRVKRVNVLGIATFVGLRGADAVLQYAILHEGWGARLVEFLGGSALNPSRVIQASTGQLSPYHAAISWMAFGSSLKQILTMLIVSEQDTPVSSAILVAFFNTVFNSLNSIFSLWQVTSQAPDDATLSPLVLAGTGLYLVGILTEFISELQRTYFKKKPANKGKAYAHGLFSLARHINYGGYTVWRAAYALTSGGWLWGLAVGAFFFHDFASRGVPVLDKYLSERVCCAPPLLSRKIAKRLTRF